MNWENIENYSYTVVDFAVMGSLLLVSIGLIVAIVNGLRHSRSRSDKGPGAT